MGLQHEHLHKRSVERRAVDKVIKRDSYSDNVHKYIHKLEHNTNGNKIKLNVPVEKAAVSSSEDVETVTNIVYATATQSFSGSIAGYSTDSSVPTTTSVASVKDTSTAASASSAAKETSLAVAQVASTASTTSATSAMVSSSTATPSAESSITSASVDSSSIASASSAATTADTTVARAATVGTPVQATRSASATADSSSSTISKSSTGLSAGGKAGLAFGIIAALALAGGLLFFCWRRKRNDAHEEITDEKYNEKRNSFFGGGAAAINRRSADSDKAASIRSTRTASTAPRLSLRPVTQFLPNILSEQNRNGENPAMVEKKSAWERRPQNGAENPFGDATVLSEKQARPISAENPFEHGDGITGVHNAPSVRSNGSNHTPKSSWEGSEPPTPKNTSFGTAAAVPVAGGQARGPNNVHRVQLDFKPSMDDELELRSGELVRMLHEYDDGWALCTRMDRSQQGVAPRTCLSKVPVKPRHSPPPGTLRQQRPGPPQGFRGPPQGANGMIPRPLTPTGQHSRPQSPAGANRQRAQTMERDQSPAPMEGRNRSQSVSAQQQQGNMPSRKPVPGMAM